MYHLQVLLGLAFTLVACTSSAALNLHRAHGELNHQQTDRLHKATNDLVFRKRSLSDEDQPIVTEAIGHLRFSQERSPAFKSHPDRYLAKRSAFESVPNVDLSQSLGLANRKSLNKRSALPAAPYRGHSFQRNSSLRQRPVRTRSRFYRTQENPNRVPPSG